MDNTLQNRLPLDDTRHAAVQHHNEEAARMRQVKEDDKNMLEFINEGFNRPIGFISKFITAAVPISLVSRTILNVETNYQDLLTSEPWVATATRFNQVASPRHYAEIGIGLVTLAAGEVNVLLHKNDPVPEDSVLTLEQRKQAQRYMGRLAGLTGSIGLSVVGGLACAGYNLAHQEERRTESNDKTQIDNRDADRRIEKGNTTLLWEDALELYKPVQDKIAMPLNSVHKPIL